MKVKVRHKKLTDLGCDSDTNTTPYCLIKTLFLYRTHVGLYAKDANQPKGIKI